MMPAETPPPKVLSPNSLMNSEKIRAKSPTSLYSPLAQDNRNNPGTENAEKPVSSPLQQHPSPSGSYGGSSREQQSTESGSGSVPATSTTGLISPNSTSSNKQNPSRAAQSATSQQFCLRWNNYQSNLTSVFDQLLQNESFVDVTLACDGQSIKAHKMVLSACSPYFQALFFDNPCQHPIIIMRDIKWQDLKAAVDFMYKGEINVSQDQIGPLLRVAEMLKIRGLADVSSETDSTAAPTSSSPSVRAPTPAVTASSPIPSRPPSSAASHVKTEFSAKKPRVCREWEVNNVDSLAFINRNRKRRWPSADHSGMESPIMHGSLGLGGNSSGMGIGSSANNSLRENSSSRSGANDMGLGSGGGGNGAGGNAGSGSSQQSGGGHMTPDSNNDIPSPLPGSSNPTQLSLPPATPNNMPPFTIPPPLDAMGLSTLGMSHADDMEIKPGIAEMIREEERAKLMESSHAWLGASTSSIADNSQGYSRNLTSSIQSDSYQYQLQSMWQKCWNTNQNLMHHLRFRERGPLKSWRPETMAEAIFSVLKEGLSLSQAARKYDIPYPTFVLYANRVHNMLGPSIDGGADLRPKGRGRPQRILLGIWPDEHIKGVIKTVVFRDAKELKEETIHLAYGRHSPVFPFQDSPLNYPGAPCSNGLPPQPPVSVGESMSPEATAAAVAAVAQGIRQQMQLAAAAQHHPDAATNLFSLPSHLHSANSGVPLPKQSSPASSGQNMNSNSQRHSSPSMAVLPSPSALGMTGIPGVHVMQPIGPNTSQSGAPISSSTSYTSNSLQTSSASAHMTPNTSTANVQMSVSNMSRMGSPSESAHDLRMNSPEESPLNSPLQMALEPAVNLAVGVSGMAYKPSRGYSPPRAENLFQEDIADLVGAGNRNCPQNMNSFKEPTPTIKLEPMAGCRSD